jgi:hypothetical protein
MTSYKTDLEFARLTSVIDPCNCWTRHGCIELPHTDSNEPGLTERKRTLNALCQRGFSARTGGWCHGSDYTQCVRYTINFTGARCKWLGSTFLSSVGLIAKNPGPELIDFDSLPGLKGCRVLHQNANKIPRKLCRLKDLLKPFRIKTIFGFTETGLTVANSDSSLKVSHYNLIRFDNTERVSLGILVYFTNDIELIDHKITSTTDYTVVFAKFKIGNDHLFFGCIYRLPNASNNFFDNFSRLLEATVQNSRLVVLAGDVNIDLQRDGPTQARYLEILENFDLHQQIVNPTRIQSNSKTLIDHVITSTQVSWDHTINTDTFLSDHNMIGIRLLNFGSKIPAKIELQTCRLHKTQLGLNFKTCYLPSLREKLAESNWENFRDEPGLLTVEKKFDKFLKILTKSLQETTRMYPCKCNKTKTIKRDTKPWFNQDLAVERKACIDLQKFIAINNCTGPLVFAYKTLRKRLIRKIEQARNFYYKNLVSDVDYRNRWKIINELRGKTNTVTEISKLVINGKTSQTEAEITNGLNEYFANIGKDTFLDVQRAALENQIEPFKFPRNSPQNSFHFCFPTNDEVMKSVLKLKDNKPSGPTEIPNRIIKEIISEIIGPLANIFRSCIIRSTIPTAFKHAHVTPIFKKGTPTNPGNYRPISVTSSFGKIFEHLLKSQVETHLTRYSVLSTTQYGFRKGFSTIHAMLDGIDAALIHLNANIDQYASFLYLDLSKAFDCVEHTNLMNALDSVGFDLNSRQLIKALLAQRSQQVKLSNSISSELPISFGVAQGSILGPQIFTIFVNDCHRILANKHTKVIQYADDVCLLTLASTKEELISRTEQNLKNAHKFFTSIGLKLNIIKTQFVPMTNADTQRDALRKTSLFSNSPSEKVDAQRTATNLGLIVDDQLIFTDHKLSILGKLKLAYQSINNVRNKISEGTAKLMYESLFLGIHDYASCVYDTTGLGTAAINEKLEKIHRAMLRCVYRNKLKTIKHIRDGQTEYRMPTNEKVYRLSSEASLSNRRKRHTATIAHEILNNRAPSGIRNLVTLHTGRQSRFSEGSVVIPRVLRTNMMKHSFSYRASTIWMDLPPDLRVERSKIRFRTRIKNSIPQPAVTADNH